MLRQSLKVAHQRLIVRHYFIASLTLLYTKSSDNLLTHGAEPFLRSCQLCSHSRNSQHFMESEGSLPCSESPPLVPILSQINSIHTIPSYLSKIHFNIVHPPTSRSSQCSLTVWLSHHYPICIPLLPHSCYMPYPSHPP
jgi:hypothetical protein